MKHPAHFSLFIAILACCAFVLFFMAEPAPLARTPETTFAPYQPLRHPLPPPELASIAASIGDPFRPKFFETARFKGVTRNANGGLCAIFLDGSNRVLSLAEGQTLDGITVAEIGSRTCRYLIGSVSRELILPSK